MKIASVLVVSVVSALFSQTVLADDKHLCHDEAEQSVHEYTTARTDQAQLISIKDDGSQVFEVRTNLHGGDAAYEIVLDSDCNTLSITELWAE